MTTTLDLQIENTKLVIALQRSPNLLKNNMSSAILRIIQNIARSAKQHATKATSTLTNSILPRLINPLYGEVRPRANYAADVELGTGVYGPQGQPSNNLPPVLDILQWIRVKRIQPNDPKMSERDLAWVIAKSIASTGTKPQPYVGPAATDNRADARRSVGHTT